MTIRMHGLRAPFAAAAVSIALLAGTAAADTVVLKRGDRHIEGTILEETDSAITLQRGSSSVRIAKTEIKEIIREQTSSDEERAGDRFARQGDWEQALQQYQKAATTANAEQLQEKICGVQQQMRTQAEEQSSLLLRDVRADIAAGRYPAAIQRLKELLKDMPEGAQRRLVNRELADSYFRYAQSLADSVQFEMAKQQLLEAVKVDPQYRTAYLELAELLRRDVAKTTEALQMYAKGFSLVDPPLTPKVECTYRFHWAELLHRIGDYEAALTNFNMVMQSCPREFPGIVNYLVDVNIRLGEKLKGQNVEQSIKALRAAIEQDKSALRARFLLAQIYYDSKRYAEGIQTLLELLEFDQAYRGANYLLSQCYRGNKDMENYRARLEKEVVTNHTNYDAICELGEYLLQGAKNEQALFLFENAIRLNDGPGRAHYGRAETLRKLKRLPDAEAEALAIVEKDAKNPQGLIILGQVQADQEKLTEADGTLLKAVALLNEKGNDMSAQDKAMLSEAYSQIGEVALKAKSSNKAYENYAKALQLNPQNARAYHNMATALVDAKRLDEAEQCYIRAIEQKPDEADFFLGLAILYHTHRKQTADALPLYLKYLELGGEPTADVTRWISQCGGQVGQKSNLNVASLTERVKRLRMASDGATTGTLAMAPGRFDGATTGTMVLNAASQPATTQAVPAAAPLIPAATATPAVAATPAAVAAPALVSPTPAAAATPAP